MNEKNSPISLQAGNWLGWIAAILGVIAFFWQPLWLSIVGIVLGIIGLFSPAKNPNWIAITICVAALIVYLI